MNPSWMQEAACRNQDPEIFFPFSTMAVESARAITICRTCPVRLECYGYAVQNHETEGIWGGTDFGGRRNIVRGSYEEEEIREAVYMSLDSGWSMSKAATNLRIPFNMIRRFARERGRETEQGDATVNEQQEQTNKQPLQQMKSN